QRIRLIKLKLQEHRFDSAEKLLSNRVYLRSYEMLLFASQLVVADNPPVLSIILLLAVGPSPFPETHSGATHDWVSVFSTLIFHDCWPKLLFADSVYHAGAAGSRPGKFPEARF